MYISHFKNILGIPTKIENLVGVKGNKTIFDTFSQDGFRYYLKFEEPVSVILRKLITESLQDNELDKDSIDAVIFVSDNAYEETCTLGKHTRFNSLRNNLYFALSDNGVTTAYPYIVGGAGCTNLTSATTMAGGFFKKGLYKKILVLLLDKLDDRRRIMPVVRDDDSAVGSIGSDIAASFVLSAQQPESEYMKLHNQFTYAQLSILKELYQAYETQNPIAYKLEVVKGLIKFRQKAMNDFGRKLGEYEEIYVGNYVEKYFSLYAKQFKWSKDQLKIKSKADIAHIQSLDSLYSIFNAKENIDNAIIFLFGPCMWSAIQFSYNPPPSHVFDSRLIVEANFE